MSTIERQERKVQAILEWVDNGHPEFDAEFVESMSAQLDEGEELTPRQEGALDNIIEGWGIDI